MSRIILVDGDPLFTQASCNALMTAGHAAGSLADGNTAMHLIRVRPPHLLIVDFALPGFGGVHFVRQLRREPMLGEIPVLMLSAGQRSADEAVAFDAGADDYLAKPVEIAALVGRANALLIQSRGPSAIAV